jgi:type IV pilus assembly protein PilM
MKQTYFYHDKPLFGLDIGKSSLKVMQVSPGRLCSHQKLHLNGYGSITFDNSAIDNGVIIKPEVIAEALLELFKSRLNGSINTRRVAITIPSYRTFTRSVQLPRLSNKELQEALHIEAEQYIQMPLDDLYIDYDTIRQTKDASDIFSVAVPREIVNSYVTLADIAGLEPVLIESTMSAAARLFSHDKQSDVPTVIIDFGSLSSDICIYNGTLVVTGTVQGGGMDFNNNIRQALNVSPREAAIIKTKYALAYSKKQKEITKALKPTLDLIVKEIRRMMRYYEERFGTDKPITQIYALGGGANMPGMTEYFTEALRMAVRPCDPWLYFNNKRLAKPSPADKPMYATVAGLAMAPHKEVLR